MAGGALAACARDGVLRRFQLLLAVAVVPVERSAPDRDRLRAIARRFGYGTLLAIAVLLATGSAMASHFDLWGNGTLQTKLVLVALVAVLVVWHMRRPAVHALEAAIFVASLVIVWLGSPSRTDGRESVASALPSDRSSTSPPC